MKFKRIYHPYNEWEEIEHNMWGCVQDRKLFLKKAIKFTSDYKLYGRFMMRVIHEWPISCENALTDKTLNRKAWVGHAACALALGCPEDITRQAWGNLTDEQQLLANKKAERAIKVWEYNFYSENKSVHKDVDGEMLF